MTTEQRRHEEIRWGLLSRVMPACVREILESIDVVGIRNETAEEVERTLFGWVDRLATVNRRRVRVDAAMARSTWSHTLGTERRRTLGVVREVVDQNKRLAQYQKLQNRELGTELLPQHRHPVPQDGVLVVRPPLRRFPYFGLSGYMEATPVEIPVYVARCWQERTGKQSPRVWDPTAGSNTVAEVLRTIFGARVAATDIVSTDTLESFGDLRDIGFLPHQRIGEDAVDALSYESAVGTPDLVFIDPPSRGRPTHSGVYRGDRPELDLAALDPPTYAATLVAAVASAVRRLAPRGLVSLLLREGRREHQRVTPDPRLVEDLLTAIGEFGEVKLLEHLRIHEPAPVNQASLGTTRYPMTHLLFARRS